ncbi:hypothetical protein SPI_03866 [Niveomyces insectorum RCEF 264]|uniref:Uncharacterized protein n=1 Tax=Niveomyces insectorum RCEF 264 TaxID=1081102 RepID=A0A167WEZ8_9HYPO|nr:hypothetical protein SPI_03866 [Niveomyces insectorum RCEF 264]
MVLYAYLVALHEKLHVPAHWAILVTKTENGTQGAKYHAIGHPFRGYSVEVIDNYDVNTIRERHTLVFLGRLDDAWTDRLASAARSVAAPGISPEPLNPFAVSSFVIPVLMSNDRQKLIAF